MGPSPGRVFAHRRVVAFGECDPAGVAYFPRIFDWFHQAMEAWFDALGTPYAEVIRARRIGLPSAHTEADFLAPCWLGDALVVELRVERLAERSLVLGYEVRGEDGTRRVRGRTAVVVVDLDPASAGHFRPIAIPDDLRAEMRHYVGPPVV